MNSEIKLITLKKTDPDFKSYLWGQGDGQIARPVQSLNIGSEHEVITFELIGKSQIQKPNLFFLLSQLIKLNRFIYICLPFFFILANAYLIKNLNDPISVVAVFLAVMFLFIGINLRNDVVDYISGYDRVESVLDKKPITQGWVTASFASKLSKFFIFLSVLLAAPALILYRKLFILFLVTASLMLLGRFLDRNFYKQKNYAEFILFLLIGPGLLTGLQLASGAELSASVIAFGLVWGLCILFLIHINNFCSILKSSQARITNTITTMGFDQAQNFLAIWALVILLTTLSHQLYFYGLNIALIAALPMLFSYFYLITKIKKIQSPLSSDLFSIRKYAQYFFLSVVLFFVVQRVSLLGVGFFESL